MRPVILRREYSDERTTGTLYMPSGDIIKTLELPWRDNARNVSCIPEGFYLCVDGVILREDEFASVHLKDLGQEILKEQYRHIVDGDFWDLLQDAHDLLAVWRGLNAKAVYKRLTGQDAPERAK